jgi:hypothetical protein
VKSDLLICRQSVVILCLLAKKDEVAENLSERYNLGQSLSRL